MLRGLILGAALALAVPALAQTQTQETPGAAASPAPSSSADGRAPAAGRSLADLRADLKAVAADLKSLRGELNASGQQGFRAAGGDAAIDRMNAMERELSRLTGETEQLKNRIDRVVRDGTNRIGDIEFRLCEMEDGCDLAALATPTLGDVGGGAEGGAAAPAGGYQQPGPVAGVAPADVPLTVQERADFDRASDALQAGQFGPAAELFGQFAATHAGSPAAPEALFLKGAALDSAGDTKGASAAWLQAFAAAPTGPRAPDALLGLARVSSDGAPAADSCIYLTELTTRFSGTPQADEAARRSAAAGCDALTQGGPSPNGASPALPADPGLDADPEAAADLVDGG